MSITQAIITYFCVWWLVWLAVLPFGVRRVDHPKPLHDPGAPEKPHLLPKFIATTLLAAVITFATMELINSGWISLDLDEHM